MIIRNKKESDKLVLIPNFNIPKFIHRDKRYHSELLLITNYKNKYNLIDWIIWHLYIIKFDHIKIIFNTDKMVDTETIRNFFGSAIECIILPGNQSQSAIYTKYVNESQAEWVFPIDDDEYVYLNNFNEINEFLTVYGNNNKISFPWILMFSKSIIEKFVPDNKYFLTYCYYYYNLTEPIYFKTIVNTTKAKHIYKEEQIKQLNHFNVNTIKYNIKDNYNFTDSDTIPNYTVMGTVHNPISIDKDNKYLLTYNVYDKKYYIGYNFNIKYPVTNINFCGLFHFKYRTLEEYISKINNTQKFIDLPKEYFENESLNRYYNVYNNSNNFIFTDKLLKLYEQYKYLFNCYKH